MPEILTQASEVTVDGLQEAIRLAETKTTKAAEKTEKLLAKKIEKMVALRDGVVTETNPKGNHNPQVFAESVRQVPKGDEILGLVSKGWVVTIRCATCEDDRVVNLQDAFQVRFCSKSCKPSKSGSAVGTKAARELLKQHSLDDLKKLLAEKQEAEAVAEPTDEAVVEAETVELVTETDEQQRARIKAELARDDEAAKKKAKRSRRKAA